MCGIIGYSGKENAVPILIKGLEKLEYRGYDSSGISVFHEGGIITVKSCGRISNNSKKIEKEPRGLTSHCGIGHTRWATHGVPSDINSHPHTSEYISLVHNGIIENYTELRADLSKKGYTFLSDTDTEAAVMLIDSLYRTDKDPVKAIFGALEIIRGSYAFGIMFKDIPGKIYAVKKDSPLICAKTETGCFIASDVHAVLEYTDEFYVPCDGELAVLTENDISFTDRYGNTVVKTAVKSTSDSKAAEKNGFPHFMLKEIFEQPNVVMRTFDKIMAEIADSPVFCREITEKCRMIHIVACGTAMHAGLIGKYFIEKYTRKPVEVSVASEFRYADPVLYKDDIFIALSQSGETADTIAAMRLAKSCGLYTVAIVNVKGSTVAREADRVIYTPAGPEIAVASTKAYTVQCCTLYILALSMALECGRMCADEVSQKYIQIKEHIPSALNKALGLSKEIKNICGKFRCKSSVFYIGRGLDSALAAEASLKLKEISYIHSEAYAAGELKHGTISLISEGTPVIAIITEGAVFEKTLSNIKEVLSRGADITLICTDNIDIPKDIRADIIQVPYIENDLSFLCAAVAFQLIAYHTADMLGCDIDKPRNLAKSVTVE